MANRIFSIEQAAEITPLSKSSLYREAPNRWGAGMMAGRGGVASEIRVLEPEERPFYTIKALAKRLSVTDRMVRKLIETGQIRSYSIGKARRIAPEDVDSYLASRCEDRAA